MKKEIVFLVMVLCLCQIVFAKIDADIDIVTTEDMDAHIGLDAGRDLSVWINGVPYDQRSMSSTRSMSSIYNQFSDIFIQKDGTTGKYHFPEYDNLQNYEQRFRWTMTQYILSTTENQLGGKFDDISFWLELFKLQYTEEELCQMKIDTAKELNMNRIRCGDIVYHIDHRGTVFTMENIFSPMAEELTQPQKLCKSGMKSFCSDYKKQSYKEIICPDGQWINGKCLQHGNYG